MRKLVPVVLIVVLVVAVLVSAMPAPVNAWYEACELAASFGWHAHWANVACLFAIMADIIGSGDWEPV